MERRYEARQEVSLSMEILDPPHLGKVRLQTRDLSKEGAFILLDRDKSLPGGARAFLAHTWPPVGR
ncbi:MAG TPA: hypothetical protein VFU39_05420 [Sulfuricaulis sp.]|nr:hypothetical protein [Sulfuricaulis sp.]